MDALLKTAMHADRIEALKGLRRVKQLRRKGGTQDRVRNLLAGVEKRLRQSAERRTWRRKHVPAVSYDPALPITARKDDIIRAIQEHPVVIVAGETGSGKTTQIPKFCLAAGRGIDGMIGCTQPRRIAASTVSQRIADELSVPLGDAVGYKIRFKEKAGRNTFIKIMTDGILLAETQNDPYLNNYDTIIVDEAHERSLNIDFVLGILKGLLERRRDLKLIITSATIDTEKFSKAFGKAPIIEVSGRMYPVETRYAPAAEGKEGENDTTHVDMAAMAVERLKRESRFGDILVFMPTEQDIRDCCSLIEGKKDPRTTVLPLYARLSAGEQKRVFKQVPGRKIIVATNVAETSITIPGIKYVVDSGLARMSQYNPRYRITALPIVPVSRSSADQRKGRCGRVENGICVRLFDEDNYLGRPLYTQPEILRSNLAEVILRMIHLKLGAVETFSFIDRPADKSIKGGFNLLLELGAIKPPGKSRSNDKRASREKRRKPKPGAYRLTATGRLMAKLPLDPRLSKMIIEARRRNCLEEITVIAAALSIQDPRERPAEKKQAADEAQSVFRDPQSDFITLLNIWQHYRTAAGHRRSAGKLKKFCKAHFLSFRRMREWLDIHHQISMILEENAIKVSDPGASPTEGKGAGTRKGRSGSTFSRRYTAVHKTILSGFLSNIARQQEKQYYKGARDREVMIFPGSGLFKTPGPWIVAAEFVETSRLFARIAANIDVDWLEAIGRDQCRRTYRDPHWEKNREEVVAIEQVSLYGLIIVPGRPASFGPVDPVEATRIFIEQALVTGEIKTPFGFLKHNLELIEEIRSVEDKFRRRDILVHDEEMAEYYRKRLPDEIFDARTLRRLIRVKGSDDFLKLNKEALLRYTPDQEEIKQFPDKVTLGNKDFEALYQFDPGRRDDGLTVKIPATEASSIDRNRLDWMVPGMIREKIAYLIKSLPKAYRKRLVPVNATVETIMQEMPADDTPLVVALGNFIHRRFKVDIPASAWPLKELPDHLKMRIEIIDAGKKVIHEGRDAAVLDNTTPAPTASHLLGRLRKKWEKAEITAWDFGDLPDTVNLKDGKGPTCTAYPGLKVKDGTISLRLFQDEPLARASHRKGVATLFARKFSRDLKFLKQNLKLSQELDKAARYFGGRKKVEQLIFDDTVDGLFEQDIRSESAYLQQEERFATEGLHTRGSDKLTNVIDVLKAHHAANMAIHRLGSNNMGKMQTTAFLELLVKDMDGLVPENFAELYDTKRLGHLPRYLKAIAIRAERGVVNLEKDRQRADEIKPLQQSFDELVQSLGDAASREKRTAVEALFWLFQEYKVSVFAQELKTAVPVSRKKLRKMIGDIERMI